MRARSLWMVVLVLLVAAPGFAADRTIQNGIDTWVTRGNGATFINFAKNPIPAGFFCAGSAPFSGKHFLEGVPVATGTPGALGRADTILQRLDDAVFDKRGVAVTRLQFRALNLQSIKPLETACGKFHVTVHLSGEQPITRMVITRENANGGRFVAPISLNTKVSFTPVGRATNEVFEIPMKARFPAKPYPWANKPSRPVAQVAGFVRVDTDGDSRPDLFLPGNSDFFPGHYSRPAARGAGALAEAATIGESGDFLCMDAESAHAFH